MIGRLSRRALVATAVAAASISAPAKTSARDATPTAPTSSLGWGDAFDEEHGWPNVATTVAPISSIVRNVGGMLIDLHGVVPDGTNSHTFEPAPSDAILLAKADLVIVNGLRLEEPTIELAEANLREGVEIFALGERTIAPEEYAYDFSFPEDEGKPNPHLWPNVAYAMRYAELTADVLSERDPANAAAFRENLDRYLAVLTRLDEGVALAVQTIPEHQRKLLTYHDSWAYFARRYGMTVIGAAQPSDFSEPSPREVARLIEQIKDENLPAVFGSEIFASSILEQIAEEAGAVYVDGLRDDDPPGEPGDPDHTYLGMMLRNMELMIPALGGNIEALAGIEPFDTWSR